MGTFKIGKVVMKSLFKKPATLMYPVVPREWFERTRGHIDIDGAACIGCGMCAKKCPTNAITVDKAAGTWEIQRMQCIQCGRCTEVCPKTCLTMGQKYTEPGVAKVIDTFEIPKGGAKAAPAAKAADAAAPAEGGLTCSDECVLCGACVDACPAGAITVDGAWSVDKDACLECGACVDACPVGALALGEAADDATEAAPATNIAEQVSSAMDGRRITVRPFFEGEFAKKVKKPEETNERPVAVITEDTVSNPTADAGLVNDIDNCIYCGICAKTCKIEALAVDRKQKIWYVDRDRCAQCSACVDKCPKKCLEMK